ncbi:MAG: hypothetical protein QG655_1236 [Actinomycetota bacterium]|nr:hypothetical protein [Actinomycetota bacterium]
MIMSAPRNGRPTLPARVRREPSAAATDWWQSGEPYSTS